MHILCTTFLFIKVINLSVLVHICTDSNYYFTVENLQSQVTFICRALYTIGYSSITVIHKKITV